MTKPPENKQQYQSKIKIIHMQLQPNYENSSLTKTVQSTVIYHKMNLLIQRKDTLTIQPNAVEEKTIEINGNICRICYEPGIQGNELISPCSCVGSIKYIHFQCLKKWIIEQKENMPFFHCEICKDQYSFQFKDTLIFSREKYTKYKKKALILISLLALVILIGGILIWLFLSRY